MDASLSIAMQATRVSFRLDLASQSLEAMAQLSIQTLGVGDEPLELASAEVRREGVISC